MSHNHQPDSWTSLTGDHGWPGKEKLVKTVGEHTKLLFNFFLVFDDVVVPHFDGVSVMDSLVSSCLDFEATSLNLVNVPVKRAWSISSREDIFAHENTPDKVLVFPFTSQTGNLEEEKSVGFKECFNLGHVLLVVSNSDVFTHLEAWDFVELSEGFNVDFSVVEE